MNTRLGAVLVFLSFFIFKTISKKQLYIGGLFPMSKLPGEHAYVIGPSVVPSIEIAMELMNSRNDILPDYQLNLIWNDTKAHASVATKAFFEFIHDEPTKIMIFGPLLSRTVLNIAAAAPAWNLLQMSCVTRTSEMNDRSRYPMFFRTLQEDSGFNIARLRLIQKYNWKRVSILYESHPGNIYYSSVEKLSDLLTRNNITVQSIHNVDKDPKHALLDIKKHDVRIIIGSYYVTTSAKMYCEAFKAGLYGKKYVWIEPGWAQSQASLDRYMHNTDCEYDDVKKVSDGNFYFGNVKKPLPSNDTVFGMSFTEFESRYINLSSRSSVSEYALYGFDGMLSIALALHEASNRQIELEEFSYDNASVSETLLDIMYNLNFNGITGPVAFDGNGNRIGITEIKQLQNGVRIHVADYNPFTDTFVFREENPVVWKGKKIPLDGTRKDVLQLYIPEYTFLPLAIICFAGVILAVVFLIFNIKKKDLKYIKLSSPMMNNVIAVGCVLAYICVILYGLDINYASAEFVRINCKLRLWVLACSFSLAFGALFSKTWRVHVIMSKKTKKKVVVTDWQLVVRILVLLLVDFVYLTIWTIIDPFFSVTHTFSDIIDPNDDDHLWTPQYQFCDNTYKVYWIGGLLVYKGLLLVLGLFLAWETRNIRIEALNDSKYIGICVYNVSLMCIMGVPVGFLVGEENFIGGYVITSVFIILSTTITLCLVFVPKIIELRRNPFGDVNIFNQSHGRSVTAATSKIAPIKTIPSNAPEDIELKKPSAELVEIFKHKDKDAHIHTDEVTA